MSFDTNVMLVVRIVLGLVLTFSGFTKVIKLKNFFITVVKYNLIKGRLAKLVAYTLPFLELFTGIVLLTGFYLKIVTIIALIIFALSTFAVSYALFRKNKMDDCGCYGGTVKVPVGWKKLVENIILILVTIYLLIF
jgi:uncharacterized membrane protein YphA (DoxX/SURF4 family)